MGSGEREERRGTEKRRRREDECVLTWMSVLSTYSMTSVGMLDLNLRLL